ncbi:MAG: hypothetical protein V4662_12705 [Verrucomicrobiota bacterium]
MNTDWSELIQRYITGSATAEETASLQEAMKADPKLRAAYLDLMNLDVALGAAADASDMMPLPEISKPRPIRSNAWMQWRPLTAAAAGLMIGLFSASIVFAYSTPRLFSAKSVRRLWSESFESAPRQTLPGLPSKSDVWTGDEARVVTAESELKPKIGGRMLRLLSSTFAGEAASRSGWGNVYRLVDLRDQEIDNASLLRLTAQFLAAEFPAGEEYVCFLELCALEDDPADAPQPLTLPWVRENSASVAARKIRMKGQGQWQGGTVEMPITTQTRYALVHLAIQRSKPIPSSEPVHFSGHYLDDVKLELRTQPRTALPE